MDILVNKLNFSYGSNLILKDINFSFNNNDGGKVIGIIGPNGTGKSTLMQCMAGFHKNVKQNILIDNISYDNMDKKHITLNVSYLSQLSHINAHLTAFEIVLLVYKSNSSYRVNDNDLKVVSDIFKYLSIEYLANKSILEMSGGQKQLVFLAKSLLLKKPIMLLDEPTSALDIYHQIKMMKLIKKSTYENKSITFVALHDLNLVSRFCDEVMVLHNSTINNIGKISEVFNKSFFKNVYNMDCYIGTTDKGNIVIQPEDII
ncbi:ABC transporter ATP-binding protein [Alphaproteobacteria bacterium]|nr:ABC transporter ATP-binding protein [Alphaproteobacteria bacterium]